MSDTAKLTAEKFLRALLTSDESIAALVSNRVYRNKAPGKTDYPLIVFAYQDGSHQKAVGTYRLTSAVNYAVRAIDRVPATVADRPDAIAAVFDELLENASQGNVLAVECVTPLARAYTIDGIDYEESGGLYRLLIKGG